MKFGYSVMRRICRSLWSSVPYVNGSFASIGSQIHRFSPIATTSVAAAPSENHISSSRDSLILEKLRQRRIKGEYELPKTSASFNEDGSSSQGGCSSAEAIYGFRDLGLNGGALDALDKMNIAFPTEIQAVSIPAILEGKSVVMGSLVGSGRTLSYMLSLAQILGKGEGRNPRAVVLCPTKDHCDQAFSIARLVSQYMNFSPAMVSEVDHLGEQCFMQGQTDMVIGTPLGVLRHFELGCMVYTNINCVVFDDVDCMYGSGMNLDACKLVDLLRGNRSLLQAVLVTGPMIEVLGEKLPSFLDHLERDYAGVVAAMLLEFDPPDLFILLDSLDALRDKIVDAMDSLRPSACK